MTCDLNTASETRTDVFSPSHMLSLANRPPVRRSSSVVSAREHEAHGEDEDDRGGTLVPKTPNVKLTTDLQVVVIALTECCYESESETMSCIFECTMVNGCFDKLTEIHYVYS